MKGLFGTQIQPPALRVVPPIPLAEEILAQALTAARGELGNADYAVAWAEGRAMTLEHAIAYALDHPAPT